MLEEMNLFVAGHDHITKAEVEAVWAKMKGSDTETALSYKEFLTYFRQHLFGVVADPGNES